MNNQMLALYGLKWDPFAPAVPAAALHVTARVESFCWRVSQLVGEGGFALVTGAPGAGKSAALRILAASLANQRDVSVGVISRPQANIADFYREMGDLFGVELHPHNRWGGAKILRQRWQSHIDQALSRPVLVIDEAQEMRSAVLALRLPRPDNDNSWVSVSIGAATLHPARGSEPEELVTAADGALYAAKEAGRNCVRVSRPRSIAQQLAN